MLALLFAGCTSPPSRPGRTAKHDEPEPTLAKAKPAKPEAQPAPKKKEPPPAKHPHLAQPWTYVLPVDHGMRADSGGQGGFLAPRYHGKHNGLDMLAPLGTPVFAPCAGSARAGRSRSFGKWVQVVCPLPRELTEGRPLFGSIFYCHLSKTSKAPGDFAAVERGETIGAVGKSGNASGSKIAPHLHLEIIVHEGEQAARAERHSGRNQDDTPAARLFLRELDKHCFAPNELRRQDGQTHRARRADPFLVLSCLTEQKPKFSRPDGKLAESSVPWSKQYVARGFDVDVGR